MPKRKQTPPPETQGYTPPANPEAEQSVLGAILVRPEVLDEVSDLLQPEDFYREAHSRIYRVMLGLYNVNEPVDLVTVNSRLKEVGWLEAVGGPVFLAGLSEQVGFATNGFYYAKLVRQKAMLRRLLDASQEIAGRCLAPVEDIDTFLNAAEEKIYQIKVGQKLNHTYALHDLVPGEVTRLEKIFERKKEVLGIPSGFLDLDALTNGWQDGDLIILAARPSMGKTALAVNMSYHAAGAYQTPVAFYSLEQPRAQLVQRWMASAGMINSTRLRSARMSGEEWAKLGSVSGELMDLPIHIIDQAAMTLMEVRSSARRLKSREGIGLIIVDYLQLMREPKARVREQEIGGISRGLKALAKELNIPVIALAQLSRECEKRPNKRPQLSDLRESGAIEQDADVVLFIYRDEVYREDSKDQGVAEIRLAKHRNGPIGMVKLTYLKEFMLFQNYAEHPADAGY